MGGRVDMGAAALRQAALCWWRRCCMTIACSRLCTILSPGPLRCAASCCCVSGGLAMLSLMLDLHGGKSCYHLSLKRMHIAPVVIDALGDDESAHAGQRCYMALPQSKML